MDLTLRDKLLAHLDECGYEAHSDAFKVPRHQIVLLGGNPLPIRVALEAIAPAHVVCLTTREILSKGDDDGADALGRWARSNGVEWTTEFVENASQETDIAEALDKVFARLAKEHDGSKANRALSAQANWLDGSVPVGLHYTGGTKAMVAGARVWWDGRFFRTDGKTTRHQCTYFDSRKGLTFGGVRSSCRIVSPSLTLKEIADLHGSDIVAPPAKDEAAAAQHDALAMALGDALFKAEKPVEAFYAALPPIHGVDVEVTFSDSGATAAVLPWGHTSPFVGGPDEILRVSGASAVDRKNLTRGGALANVTLDALADLCGRVDLQGRTIAEAIGFIKRPEKRLTWLSGMWFEHWLLERVRRHPLLAEAQFVRGLELSPRGTNQRREVDTVFRVGHEVVLVSTTMAAERHLVRAKAHMARTQASNLGGDHCRFIMATWMRQDSELEIVARELAQHWVGPDRFRILGYDHYLGRKAPTHLLQDGSVAESLDEMLTNWFE